MSGGDGACAAHKEDAECCRSGGRWDDGSGGACSGVSRSNVRGEKRCISNMRWGHLPDGGEPSLLAALVHYSLMRKFSCVFSHFS